MPTSKKGHSPPASSRSASRSASTTDESYSSGSWDPQYSDDPELDPSDSASHSPLPSSRRPRATSASRPSRRHTTSERSSRRHPARVSRQAPLPPPSSVDPDDYPGYGRGYPAPQPGPYGGRMGPGYAASAFSAPGAGAYGPPPFGGALTQYGPQSAYQQYPPPQGNPFSPQASPVPPGGAGYFSGAPHPMSTYGAPPPGHGHDLMAYPQAPGYGYPGYHPPPGGMPPPHMGYFPPGPHWPPGGDPSVVGDPEMEKKMLAIEEKMRSQSIDFEKAKKEIEARDAAAAAAKSASEARAEADRRAKEEKEAWEKKLDEETKAAQKQGAENARKQIEADRRKAEEKAAEEKAMADAKAAVEKAETDAKAAVAKAEAERKEAIEKAEKEAKEAVAKAEKEAKEAVDKALAPKDDKKKPIKFKDAVGRKFSFPFHLCATWAGMEELIRQAFLHVEGIGPLVADGHYDLIGPNGEIILPQVWETMIEPDWSISMHMWPMPEPRIPPVGAGIERPRSRHDHGRHGRMPAPPMGHRGGPPPPPPAGYTGPRLGGPGMPPIPGIRPGPGPAPGPGATPVIIPVKPARKKSESSKSVLGWMAGKPSKSSGKGPKKAEQHAACVIM